MCYRVQNDNYYSSYALILDLKQKGFEDCGTVGKDRKGLSETFKSTDLAKYKKNNQFPKHCICEVYSDFTDDDKISLKWNDKRMVHMISTFHTNDMMKKQRRTKAVTEGVETVQKPVMIDDYNLHMGGINKSWK